MIDSEYFRTILQTQVDQIGGDAIVELHLLSGRAHRLRSVAGVQGGYVILDVYRGRGEHGSGEGYWRGKASRSYPSSRRTWHSTAQSLRTGEKSAAPRHCRRRRQG